MSAPLRTASPFSTNCNGGIHVKKRTILSLSLLLILMVGLVLPAHANDRLPRQQEAEALALEKSYEQQITVHGSLPALGTPSQEEIRAKWEAVTNASTVYLTAPSVTAPYATGTLSEDFLESGITYLNYVRFVAGLPEVTLDDSMNENAQYGAVLLAAIDELTHYPSRPGDMEKAFFDQGYSATSSSNISARWGYSDLTTMLKSAVLGCMNDNNSQSNLEAVGHRRWLLNPTLGKVGFGYAVSKTERSYIVAKVFDSSGTGCDYDFISWPVSGNHPTNLFDVQNPWSLTLNPQIYQKPSLSTVKITVTQTADGTQWHFDSTTGDPIYDVYGYITPYLTVENSGYGVSNCIIFHPGTEQADDYTGTYHVEVSGIYLRSGEETSLSYDVHFFDVETVCTEHNYEPTVTEPTCTEEGCTTFTCSLCGHSYVDCHVGVVDHRYENGQCIWCGKQEPLPGGICGENATWTLNGETLIISGTGDMYDFEYACTPWYDLREQITALEVCDGITRIGENAFRDMTKLRTASLSDTIIEIGNFAFSLDESLEAIVLPANLEVLGQQAFFLCTSITSVEIPGSLCFMDICVFEGCTALTDVLFRSNGIPASLVLGNSPFRGCTALEEIRVEDGHFALVSLDGVLYTVYGTSYTLHQYPLGKKDTSLILPEGTVTIGQLALEQANYLQSVTIPGTVETIWPMAFDRCENLTEINFTGDAPEIMYYAFRGVTATAYYPADNETWTENVMQDYNGTITWVPYGVVSEPTAKIISYSTSLGGNIAMNFYVELSEDLVADPDAYIQFSFADKTVDVPLSEGVLSGSYYRFACPITSKNMTDDITAQVYNANGPVGDPKTMAVDTYCNWIIANTSDQKTINLMKAMLNYGASAQMLFNYRTDDLANAALADADKTFGKVDASAFAHSRVGEEDGIKPVSYTLLLDSETTVRCYFQLTGTKTIDEFTFMVDGEEVTPTYKDGYYYIEKANIAAHRLDDMHTFTCGNITITYGGMSYVNQVMTYYTSGTTFDMASALYAYSKAAESYIG